MRIKTNRPLEVSDEVTVSYADDYFQIGECKCQNCNDRSIIEHVGLEESPDKRPLSEELQQPHFHGWSNLFSRDNGFFIWRNSTLESLKNIIYERQLKDDIIRKQYERQYSNIKVYILFKSKTYLKRLMFLSASPAQFMLQAKRFQLSPASSESTISIAGEQQVDDELPEMRNYDDELPEMRKYDDELPELRNYDDELPEMRNYDDELPETRNYDDELPETWNYDVPQINSSDSSDKEEGHAQKRKREKKVKTDARVKTKN